MSTRNKKKKGKKNNTKNGKTNNKKGGELKQLRDMMEALKKQLDTMQKSIKKQNKRILNLENENKRIKKTMLGGGLKQSATPGTSDIEQSDVEFPSIDEQKSIDDDQKKQDKKEKVKSPKPIARRNKAKPKKKASDMKFTFDLNHANIIAMDNGSGAKKKKSLSGTIRFGRFLNFKSNNKDNIAMYKITFDTRAIGQVSSSALGFATSSFSNWKGSNFGQNNCCLLKGNGMIVTTDKVFKCVDGKEYKHKQVINDVFKKDGFFKGGEDVTVQVDLKKSIGKIWNETLNKGGQDNEKVFEIVLPEKYEICVVAYLSGSAQKILSVKEQDFVFDDEEE